MSLLSIVDAILKATKAGLSADEKYFLIRLLAVYGYEEMVKGSVVGKTIDELEKCLGMSDNLIKKVRDSLTVKNYLTHMTVSPQSKTGQGRPRAGFSLSKEMINLLDVSQRHCIHEDHIPRIERLLLWHDKGSGQQKSINDLKPSNRILLAILYSRANSCGMVNDLGVMSLAKLSGLFTRDRTEGQLDKITKLGYILDRVSGTTGKYFLGKVQGEFFLNLFNDPLSQGLKPPLLVLLSYNIDSIYTDTWAVNMLFNSSMFIQKGVVYSDDLTFKALNNAFVDMDESIGTKLFSSKHTSELKEEMPTFTWCNTSMYGHDLFVQRCVCEHNLLPILLQSYLSKAQLKKLLQHKINYYASILLSQHWDSVTPEFSIIAPCFQMLSDDLISVANKKNLEKLCENFAYTFGQPEILSSGLEKLTNNVIEFFIFCTYRLVFETAFLTKGLLEYLFKDDEVNFNQATYSILSVGYTPDEKKKNFGLIANFNRQKNNKPYVTVNVLKSEVNVCKYQDLSFLTGSESSKFTFYVKP